MKIPPGISIGDRFENEPAIWEVCEYYMLCVKSGHQWDVGNTFPDVEWFVQHSEWKHISNKSLNFINLYDKLSS